MKVNSKFKPDYSIDSTTVNNIALNDSDKYDAQIVSYAKWLKATYKEEYTDSFYLEFASKHYRGISANYNLMRLENKNHIFSSQNMKWARYSYEEIIRMENGGVKIPKEVLIWAHSQQETDVTSYVVIEDNMDVEQPSDTDETGGDLEVNNLRTNVQKGIIQSQKITSLMGDKLEEFTIIANRVKDIKKEKEDTYLKEMKEISSYAQELERLDDKQKKSILTDEEKSRYNELKNILGSRSDDINELKNDNGTLKDYIDSLQQVRSLIQKSDTIVDESLEAIEKYGQINLNIPSNRRENALSALIQSHLGNSFLGASSQSSIIDIASKKINDLQDFTLNILSEANKISDTEMENFAQDYTQFFDSNIGEFNISDFNLIEEETVQEESENSEEEQNQIQSPENQETIEDNIIETGEEESSSEETETIFAKENETNELQKQTKEQNNNSFVAIAEFANNTSDLQVEGASFDNKDNNFREEAGNLYSRISKVTSSKEQKKVQSQFSDIELKANSEYDSIKDFAYRVDEESENSVASDFMANNQRLEFPLNESSFDLENNTKNPDLENLKLETENLKDDISDDQKYVLQKSEDFAQTKVDNDLTQDEKQNTENIEMQTSEIQTEDDENSQINLEEEQDIEQESMTEEEAEEPVANINPQVEDKTIAASATVNSDITQRTSNTDKENRKLTRFNNDSIIESKKKKKKVTAISSVNTGNVR